MKTRLGLAHSLQVALVLAPALLAAAAAPVSVPDEEAVELSPFVVVERTDTGYAATNALEGTRLNTALRDTPGAISIFTKDFLDDLSATTIVAGAKGSCRESGICLVAYCELSSRSD